METDVNMGMDNSNNNTNNCNNSGREVVLADDVLCHIFSFLDYRSLARACCVCKSWGVLANEPYLWQGFDLWGILFISNNEISGIFNI